MINQLLKCIGKTFEGIDARDLLCFAQIIIALIQERTVNLAKLALHCSHTSVRSEARCRRIQRFVSRCPIPPLKLAYFFMGFFEHPVLLDRVPSSGVKLKKGLFRLSYMKAPLKRSFFNFTPRPWTYISNFLVLLSFAFFWTFKIGEWLNEKAPITLKSYKRKSISFFRYGLDALIMTQKIFKRFLLLPLLSPSPKPPLDKFLVSLGYLQKLELCHVL